MTDHIARSGRYYLRTPQGRQQYYVCWTEDGVPTRRSLKTADQEIAKQRFSEFVVRTTHGDRVVTADSTDWPGIVEQMIANKRITARRRDLPMQIDAAYILRLMAASEFRCPVSGVPFTWSKEQVLGRGPWSPSIDRIENRQGYVPGNVRVVCLAANIAMNAWGYDVLLRLSHGVVGNHFHSVEVVGAAGIEPATPTMSTWCSTAELSAPDLTEASQKPTVMSGKSGA
jgi:hypothetical protein